MSAAGHPHSAVRSTTTWMLLFWSLITEWGLYYYILIGWEPCKVLISHFSWLEGLAHSWQSSALTKLKPLLMLQDIRGCVKVAHLLKEPERRADVSPALLAVVCSHAGWYQIQFKILFFRSRTGPRISHVLPCLTAYHDPAWQLWSLVITAKREDHRSGWKGNQTFLAAGLQLWSFLSPNIRLKTDLRSLKRKVWASTFQSLFLSAT